MTTEEFMEFYGGTRYVHSSDTRALLNTDLTFDDVNYRSNIFQIALQHLAHDGAADLVSTQVYRDVLLGTFTSVFPKDLKILEVLDFSSRWSFHDVTDQDIWRGKDTYPGLYRLTHARCLSVLIADSAQTRLAVPPHPDVYVPETLAIRFGIPAPWFFKAARQLRAESLLHFQVAAIAIHYYADRKVTPHWMAETLRIETTKLQAILATAKLIIEEYLDEEVQTFRRRSDSLASLWSRFGETLG